MLKIFTIITTLVLCVQAEVIPITKTEFLYQNKIHKMERNFIVISVREVGSDGRFYYVDKDGVVIWSDVISSGAENFKTPSGVFKIYHRKEYWMSTKYPDAGGTNNMNYSNFFKGGYALHQGNPNMTSHGCVHISKKYAKILFNNTEIGTPVVVTRHNYIPFVSLTERRWLY